MYCGDLRCYELLPCKTHTIDGDQLSVFEHQVSGHAGDKKGGLLLNGSTVLKPMKIGDRRCESERRFYEHTCSVLRPFIPKYYGITEVVVDGERRLYLQLENCVDGYLHPCVIDLKLGTQTYEPGASAEKIAYELSKWGLQKSHGFRISGMQLADPTTGTRVSRPKLFKKISTTEEVVHVLLKEFFVHHSADYREVLLPQLNALLTTLTTHPSHQMYASSLLIVYDAADPSNAKLKAWLIDFAHASVISPGARDEGMIFALENLISLFESGHMLEKANVSD